MKKTHFALLATAIGLIGFAISQVFAKNPGLHRFGYVLAGVMALALLFSMSTDLPRMNEISAYTKVMKESDKKSEK